MFTSVMANHPGGIAFSFAPYKLNHVISKVMLSVKKLKTKEICKGVNHFACVLNLLHI